MASGFLYDENDELPGYEHTAAVLLPSDEYRVETDLILEYQGGMLYAFYQDTTQMPQDQWEALAGQWVDRVWSQCDIQLRHAGHFDVDVERCYTSGAEPAGTGVSLGGEIDRCFNCPATNPRCSAAKKCDCKSFEEGGNKCTVPQFVLSNQYFMPNAINIYFVWSFSTGWEHATPTFAITCGDREPSSGRMYPWIFVNTWRLPQDTARTVLAHEIGHILLDTTSHEADSLMQVGNHLLENLTPEQCERARTRHLPVLSTRL